MTAREITYVPLAELREDPRNPKAHDHGAITASLERFSVIDPIVIDGRTGYIISGHGRRSALLAMAERGDEPPEGVALADDCSWLVPAVTGWSSRTDTEARAALIALNRTGELGGWVDDSLLSLLDELSAADPDLPVGFGDEDREALRRLVEADHYLAGAGSPPGSTPTALTHSPESLGEHWSGMDIGDPDSPSAGLGGGLPLPPREGTVDPVNLGAYRTLIVRVSDAEAYARLTAFLGTALRHAAGNGTESYWYGEQPEQAYDATQSAVTSLVQSEVADASDL